MTAASAARNAPFLGPEILHPAKLTVKTSESIVGGALVALDSSGEVVDATGAAGEGPYYVARETIAASAAGRTTTVWQGVVGLVNGDSIDASDVGKLAYVTDNQTVALTGNGACGRIVYVRAADALVYVDLNSPAAPNRGDAAGYRHLADDAALVILESDKVVEVTGVAGGTIAATMTITYPGHTVEVRMVAGTGTHLYTLAASLNAGAGTITLNAASEYVKLVCDGTTWHVVTLTGATFA